MEPKGDGEIAFPERMVGMSNDRSIHHLSRCDRRSGEWKEGGKEREERCKGKWLWTGVGLSKTPDLEQAENRKKKSENKREKRWLLSGRRCGQLGGRRGLIPVHRHCVLVVG